MTIQLMINNSPKNKINKSLSGVITYAGQIKTIDNVLNIEVTLTTDFPTYNYMYIPELHRYYFIDDITIECNSVYTLKCSIDVLQTYASSILSNNAIIERTTNNASSYLNYGNFVRNCKSTTSILQFPNGLNDNGEFILITAGG